LGEKRLSVVLFGSCSIREREVGEVAKKGLFVGWLNDNREEKGENKDGAVDRD
jgi:hypothetical protein